MKKLLTRIFGIVIITLLCLNIKINAQIPINGASCYGGTSTDIAESLYQTTDGGYIVAGYSWSNDGDVTVCYNYNDYWVIKIDEFSNLEWEKCFGGDSNEYAHSIQQTIDGGYIVAGYAESNDGDVSGNHGGDDYWVVKIDELLLRKIDDCKLLLTPIPVDISLKVRHLFICPKVKATNWS